MLFKLGGFIRCFSHHRELILALHYHQIDPDISSFGVFLFNFGGCSRFPNPSCHCILTCQLDFWCLPPPSHHPVAATPSSCNNLMKPKFDRLIPFLGVLFDFFLLQLSLASSHASLKFWCFQSDSAHTIRAPPQLTTQRL